MYILYMLPPVFVQKSGGQRGNLYNLLKTPGRGASWSTSGKVVMDRQAA